MAPRSDAPRPRPGGPRKAAAGARKATSKTARAGKPAAPRKPAQTRKPAGGARKAAPKTGRKPSRRGVAKAAPAEDVARPGWGSVARRGARIVRPPAEGSASGTWRRAVDQAADPHSTRERPAWEPERWEPEPVRAEAELAVERGTTRRPAPARRRPAQPLYEPARPPAPRKGVPPAEAARIEQRLRDASRAFERERYDDARRILKPLADRMPGSAAVRELLGVTYYRQGRWRDAIRELEAFRGLTGSSEQHPVLADSYRALRRFDEVDSLWEELRAASPSAELVTEGRIVAAGSLADRGRLPDAIRLLERAPKPPKRPRRHHLRLWYALADLYERAGDVPRARQLFTRLAEADAGFADVADRLRALD